MTELGRLLHAEWIKLRTTRMTRVLVGVAAVFTGFVVLAALAAPEIEGKAVGSLEDALRLVFSSTSSPAPVLAVLGALLVAGEYRHGTITPTFLAEPVRGRVLAGKIGIALAVGLVGALGAAVITTGVAIPSLDDVGIKLELGDAVVRGPLLGALVGLPLWCALGAAVGAGVRNQVAAVALILGWGAVVEPAVFGLAPAVGRYLPATASQALAGNPTADLLAPWAGGLVLAGYLIGTAAIAALVVVRRDVS